MDGNEEINWKVQLVAAAIITGVTAVIATPLYFLRDRRLKKEGVQSIKENGLVSIISQKKTTQNFGQGLSLDDSYLDVELGTDPNHGAYAYLDKEGNVKYFCWDGLYAQPIRVMTKPGDKGLLDLAKGNLLERVVHPTLSLALEYLNGTYIIHTNKEYIGLEPVSDPNLKGLRGVDLNRLYQHYGAKKLLTPIGVK